jgi:DNA-binding PadR family transcriptional regulator
MSVVRLVVLGVMRMRGQAHGYAVHRELLSWRVETWTSVKPGSIYHALKQLTKEGKLRAAGTEESTEGPGRTLYELTEAGGAEFRQLLDAALTSIQLEELGAGVAFMQTLPRQHVIDRLKEQHRRATEISRGLENMMPMFPQRDAPPHTQDLLALWSAAVGATARWTAQLIRRLEAGEYVMAGEDGEGTKAGEAGETGEVGEIRAAGVTGGAEAAGPAAPE